MAGPLIFSWVALAASLASAQETGQTTFFAGAGSGHQQGPFTGTVNINEFLGADRFYDAGLTGTNSLMANIEAGHIWSGHESLTHVQQIPAQSSSILGEFDRHGTWVGFVMGGRKNPANPGEHQQGIAPDAQLFSGAIASAWSGSRYSGNFSLFTTPTNNTYRMAFQTGLNAAGGTRTADVINSSWLRGTGGTFATGTDQLASVIDALANDNPRTLMTAAVGNAGSTANTVGSPATAYNNLAVGAVGTAFTGYESPSIFTSSGPNDYDDPSIAGVLPQRRQAVDIAAPGENIAAAYFGGQSGGNGPQLSGPPDGPAGGPDWYTRHVQGTSFAAPIVAGGAALVYDAAYALLGNNADARDARVVKAVLMNSADKTRGWSNAQVPHANGNGGVQTSQGLDNRVGTGRMNLDAAFDQFLSGTTDVAGTAQGNLGPVDPLGWDFGVVSEGTLNDYFIDKPLEAGTTFTATLTWFRDRRQIGSSGFADDSYDNLDLELWSAEAGVPLALISQSNSLFNNSEHFSFQVPATDNYALRVRWTGEQFDRVADINSELYAVAWAGTAVPEPGTLLLIGACVLLVGTPRRRKCCGSRQFLCTDA